MKARASNPQADAGLQRLLEGRHHDPFELLGCHPAGEGWQVRAMLPGCAEAELVLPGRRLPMTRRPGTDLFTVDVPAGAGFPCRYLRS